MKIDQEKEKKLEVTQIDEKSINLLLKDYDRLIEYKKITLEQYDRWFNIYLAVATTSIVIIIPLAQTIVTGLEPYIVNIILLGLLILGASTFTGLSFANARSIHLERAIRRIQNYFIAQEEHLEKWLYFRVTDTVIPGIGFKGMITRGITGGSPKSILVVINSIVAATIIVKIGVEIKLVAYRYPIIIGLGLVVFLVTSLLHLAYARLIFEANRV